VSEFRWDTPHFFPEVLRFPLNKSANLDQVTKDKACNHLA